MYRLVSLQRNRRTVVVAGISTQGISEVDHSDLSLAPRLGPSFTWRLPESQPSRYLLDGLLHLPSGCCLVFGAGTLRYVQAGQHCLRYRQLRVGQRGLGQDRLDRLVLPLAVLHRPLRRPLLVGQVPHLLVHCVSPEQ